MYRAFMVVVTILGLVGSLATIAFLNSGIWFASGAVTLVFFATPCGFALGLISQTLTYRMPAYYTLSAIGIAVIGVAGVVRCFMGNSPDTRGWSLLLFCGLWLAQVAFFRAPDIKRSKKSNYERWKEGMKHDGRV